MVIKAKLQKVNLYLKASTKAMPSMSPMVPPSSMMQTSGFFSSELTGIAETRSTQLWMASVMCGTTYRVNQDVLCIDI